MHHPQPYMRPPAHMPVHCRSRLGAHHRRGERGIALIMAIALIALITAATLISLRAVATESALQAHERRGREAFFAAQAGLAEARDWVRQRLGPSTNFNEFLNCAVFPAGPTFEPGFPSDANTPWFEVIPRTRYTLTTTGDGTGVDPTFAGANREMNGPDGVRIADFPLADNVEYRVFLVDDDDGDNIRGGCTPAAIAPDQNRRVWLVAVGEVAGPAGTQPHRSIVRALITPQTSAGEGSEHPDKGGEANEG